MFTQEIVNDWRGSQDIKKWGSAVITLCWIKTPLNSESLVGEITWSKPSVGWRHVALLRPFETFTSVDDNLTITLKLGHEHLEAWKTQSFDEKSRVCGPVAWRWPMNVKKLGIPWKARTALRVQTRIRFFLVSGQGPSKRTSLHSYFYIIHNNTHNQSYPPFANILARICALELSEVAILPKHSVWYEPRLNRVCVSEWQSVRGKISRKRNYCFFCCPLYDKFNDHLIACSTTKHNTTFVISLNSLSPRLFFFFLAILTLLRLHLRCTPVPKGDRQNFFLKEIRKRADTFGVGVARREKWTRWCRSTTSLRWKIMRTTRLASNWTYNAPDNA